MLPVLYLAYSLPPHEPDPRRYRPSQWTGIHTFLSRGVNTRFWKLVSAGDEESPFLPDFSEDSELVSQLEVLHLIAAEPLGQSVVFPSSEGKKSLSMATFAAGICGFPKLKLVVLEGFESPEFTRSLVSGGVPVVLDLGKAGMESQVAIEVYKGMFRGENLLKAFQEVAFTGSINLVVKEIKPEDAVPAWMERDTEAVSHSTEFQEGLWVHAGKKEVLDWHLPGGAANTEGNTLTERPASRRIRPTKPNVLPGTTDTGEGAKAPRQRPIRKKGEEIETRPPRPIRWARWAAGIMTGLAVLIVLAVTFPSLVPGDIKGIFRKGGCPFPANDPNYHVLLLPIYREGSCEEEGNGAMQKVAARLEALHEKLGLEVTVIMGTGACPPGKDQAINVGDYCRADLVVWGEVRAEAAGEETLWLNLFTPDSLSVPVKTEGGYQKEKFSPDELISAPLLLAEPVENRVCWALARRHQESGSVDQAISYLERIRTEDEAWKTRIEQMLTEAYVRQGKIDRALEPINLAIQEHPDDPGTYYRRANLLSRANYFSRALDDYSQSLQIDPEFFNALIGRAVVHQELGNYTQAIADFSRVITLQPDLAPIYVSRAEAWLLDGNGNAALEDLNQALRLSPDYADALYKRAEWRLHGGALEPARQDINQILTRYPKHTLAQLFEADALVHTGKWEEALNAYQKVLTANPSAEGYRRRAQAFILLGRAEDALSDLDKAIRMQPEGLALRYVRADLLESMGRFSDALTDIEHVLRSQPGSPKARIKKGVLLVRLGRDKDAEVQLRTAWEDNPSFAPACQALADFYLETGRADQASLVAGEGVAKYPGQAGFYVVRGRVNASQKFYSNALSDLRRALELNPRLPAAILERGALYLRMGDYSAAYRDAQAALNLDGKSYAARLLIARLELYRRDFAKARASIDLAMQLQPGLGEAYALLADWHYLQGNPAAAMEELDKALRRNPNAYVYLRKKADWQAKMGYTQEALQTYSEAIRQSGVDIQATVDRALLFLKLNQPEKAAETLDQAARVAPNHARVLGAQAAILFERNANNPSAALELLNKALITDPNSAELYTQRGVVHTAMGNVSSALSDYGKAIQIDPAYAPAYMQRGHLGRKASLYDKALADYAQAVEKDPLLAEAWYERGFIRYLLRTYDLALKDVEVAVKYAPNEPVYLGLLAKLYARNGQEELLYTTLEKALRNKIPAKELKDPAFAPYQNSARFKQLEAAVTSATR